MWASNWMNYLCTAANTTWLSLPRSTSERHRGTEGQTHNILPNERHMCQNVLTLVADCLLYFAHSDQKAKKGKECRDPVDMVKFSKVKPGVKVRTVHGFSILLYVSIYCALYCRTLFPAFTPPVSDPGVSDRLLGQWDKQSGCWHLFRWEESKERALKEEGREIVIDRYSVNQY